MSIFQGLILNGTEVINNPWIVGNVYLNTKGAIDTTDAYTGVGTATSGAPRTYFGTLVPSNDDSCIKICRNVVGSNLFSHAVRDESSFNSLVTGAYASFDAIPTLTGNIIYNHLNSFQSRQQYTGGGTLTDSLGFTYALTTSGHVVASSAFRAYDYAGAGVVDNFYALYVEPITKPTNHWIIYSSGTSKSYHAGNFGIGTSNPLSRLTVQSDTAAPTVFQDGNNGQISIWSPGLVNTVEKITFGTPNYAGAGGNAGIGAKFTGGGTYLLFGTSSTYTGISNTALRITPSSNLEFPDSADKLYASFAKSVDDGFLIGVGNDNDYANRNLIITDYANIAKDHDHDTLSANPTLFVHSATNPDVANNEWLSLSHNTTSAELTSGKGFFVVNPGITIIDYGRITMGGSSGGSVLYYDPTMLQQPLFLGSSHRNFVLADLTTGLGKNYDHALQANPTLFIHSVTDPDVNNTQWLSFAHDQTNGVIQAGTGLVAIQGNAAVGYNADPGYMFLGRQGAGEPNGTIGAYYDASVSPSCFFASNIYYNGVSFLTQDATKNMSMWLVQNGNQYWYTGGAGGVAPGTLKMSLSLAGGFSLGNAVALTDAGAGNLLMTGSITFNAAGNITANSGDIVINPSTDITEVCGVGLKTKEYNATLNNGATVSLPAGTGWGTFMIGDNQEYARVRWTSAAVPTVDESTANVATSDLAGNLCFIDGGATITIKNNLGSNLTLRYVIHYS